MGIYEFNISTNKDKYYTVFTKGQFVDTVSKEDLKYVLYYVHMFWVEIIYDDSNNKITGLKSFLSGDILNKYSNLQNYF